MASYSTNLKTWGSQGSVYPDGYNFVQGEQPVDDWDNFFTYNSIEDLFHLISLTNKRLESDSGSSHPSNPEPGNLSHRTDGVVTTDEEIFFYDGTNSVWHRLMQADGDKMSGTLDMGGYQIEDSSGEVSVNGAEIDGASLDSEWFRNHIGGTVGNGNIVPIGTFALSDTETITVTQATLTEDGFTTPALSGIDLVIVPEGAVDSTDTVTILSGDGSTLLNDEQPETTYQNTSGAEEAVMIGIDNGNYNAGTGSANPAYGSYIARTD